MKKFFEEFKKFITRGNVVDMAVGVIVGGAFTAIVNGLSNFILKPLINALLAILFKKDALSDLHTFLVKVMLEDGSGVDLTQSIYIDWGSFINAVINFFLVAFVLFTIVKIINRIREHHKKFTEEIMSEKPTKAERKALKNLGYRPFDREALASYREKVKEDARIAAEAEKKAAEEKARLEREANPTTEDLLKKIIVLLENKQ